MALGLDDLLNAIDQHEKAFATGEAKSGGAHPLRHPALDPFGNSQTNQRRFDRAIEAWLDGGVANTPETLRELARRVNALADNLAADLKEETNG
ncbi:hypothetical protein VSX64_16200 [Aurantimonas sp. C2-6-R+9]|uniref:hypothetical protein n=1 Tax=unclassified Aurantimonas TaxID=2638230 RepID=UPI002E182ECB|nr:MULTISPECIES: hypothetical protein [unclassified Aurantimonas]MEC5291822.1 hypothetical protein [Aurantimonas sp. C2-3-R2]MEC5382405.1 hypothetical protein [Aurantimonas sp. C2-6-R+9]MEC5412891.1 hypothetical protein [Aurantimonas sp. C2-4-R8]